MVAENPFAEFRSECEKSLRNALKRVFPDLQIEKLSMEKPPNLEFGQLASSLCFDLAKQTDKRPPALAESLTKAIDKAEFSLVKEVTPAGAGYINFHANFQKFSAFTIESVTKLDNKYGFVKTDKPMKIIVEHTSVNPLHPMHIGTARNPMLGDTLARLLKARGHTVYRHYYVDDVGRQSAVLAYGYEKLGRPKPEGKPDHFFGKIYTATSCLVEINRLKTELERAKSVSATQEIRKLNKELDNWISVAAELKGKYPRLFENLSSEIDKDKDPEAIIKDLNKAYETGDEDVRQLIREASETCLQGFKESLSRASVSFDSWDWESELVWSNKVQEIFEKLKETPYTFTLDGVLKFDAEKVIQGRNLKEKLGLKGSYEVPSLTLMRSDGTTLYPTRDIAYTLWKFTTAEKVINVVGIEQKLPQLQLKIALHALGHEKLADRLVHFAYNHVTLPGYRMDSRRGRYITFDEVMDEAVERAYEEVSKRSPQLSQKEKQEIANFVGMGAVRYALVEVDPSKPVVFTWDRVLNFETNSAPYIQYTHARGCSILRKATEKHRNPAYNLLKENLEHDITMILASFPEIFVEAAELLKPSMIADFADSLADKFNTFYNALPVIKAKPQELSDARLALVDAVRTVLRNTLNLIGVVAPQRM